MDVAVMGSASEETVFGEPISGYVVWILSLNLDPPVEVQEHLGRDLFRDRVDESNEAIPVSIRDLACQHRNNVLGSDDLVRPVEGNKPLLGYHRLGGEEEGHIDLP